MVTPMWVEMQSRRRKKPGLVKPFIVGKLLDTKVKTIPIMVPSDTLCLNPQQSNPILSTTMPPSPGVYRAIVQPHEQKQPDSCQTILPGA
jgi:hypothetical protein